MMSPFSWKYFTSGAAFCLKFTSLLWVAFRLSSGRPCCSARFANLSLSLWLAQARNTTRSGVQICGKHTQVDGYLRRQAVTTARLSHGSVAVATSPQLFRLFPSNFPSRYLYRATTAQSHCGPRKRQPHAAACGGPLCFRKHLFRLCSHTFPGCIKNKCSLNFTRVNIT